MHSEVEARTPPLTKRQAVRNYLGQLRPYSYADLVLLLVAAGASLRLVISCSVLWFGFLIHLEWRHRDRGRLQWPWWAWSLFWAVGVILVHSLMLLPFLAACGLYSLKKRYALLSTVSTVINGCVKLSLIALVPGVRGWLLLLVFAAMTIRNLAGDIRDAGKDSEEGVRSLPVLCGLKRNVPLIYPSCLIATSICWTVIGGLPVLALTAALVVEVGSYRWTPR